ncbi:hypothetical protein XA68_14301 [Ophiocordyceps unilateralis]|uniref:NADH-ubiquinone oxidoreductase 17.8 kDa subunit n=1 Tax=Ophiocordyceps unilateralis TaxID=268505 RepID=A0A2A9PB13_OPHUN|nr:hypothetical protein XA68_14301 [Ophiocordyceps unilateralis]
MLAARRRLPSLACRLPRTARSYVNDTLKPAPDANHKPASDDDDDNNNHDKPAAEVNESFGKGSILFLSTFLGIVLLNQFGPEKGEESALTKFILKHTSRPDDWADINALHTKTMEQAGFYRNLFENASNEHRFVDVSFPEAIQSHASRNIPPGHIRNIDDVIEHYRKQHIKDEERKAKKLAALSS